MGNDPNFATTVLNGLGGKADKATTLAGYGITDDVQIRGQKLVGAFTVECLDTTDSGNTTGILIRTKIPAADGIMPTLTIKGALSGYTAPFEAQLCWYFYENAIYQPQVLVRGVSVDLENLFNVHLSVSGGLINIRLDFGINVYLPRLTVTAIRDRVYGGSLALYQNWTSTPYAAAIAGEVKAYRVAALTTANITSAAYGLAKTGQLPLANVAGLPEALAGKTPYGHGHTIADVSGLQAALRAASGLAQGPVTQDPNLAVDQVILTDHPNVPVPGVYWHITTTFYNNIASDGNRSQLAIQYNGGSAVWVRSIYTGSGGGWTKWDRLDNQVPAGAIVYFAALNAPPGYLKANGAQVSRTTYAKLLAAIGTVGGAGDGSTTFNVPDLRGEFVRGTDDGRGVDAGRLLGTIQYSQNLSHTHVGVTDAIGSHSHTVSGSTNTTGSHTHNVNMGGNDVAGYRPAITAPGADGIMTAGAISAAGDHAHWFSATSDVNGAHAHNLSIYYDGGTESRPRNIALLACIKY
ncbi:tail fiber protein [Pseudomonas entomophila]|uniref:tail fiber protein n=1 Tax=Pseudomonas entomophila TaxID=312306 RepID=UPI003D3016EE